MQNPARYKAVFELLEQIFADKLPALLLKKYGIFFAIVVVWNLMPVLMMYAN